MIRSVVSICEQIASRKKAKGRERQREFFSLPQFIANLQVCARAPSPQFTHTHTQRSGVFHSVTYNATRYVYKMYEPSIQEKCPYSCGIRVHFFLGIEHSLSSDAPAVNDAKNIDKTHITARFDRRSICIVSLIFFCM